jgi:hypothetical protein
MYHTQTRDADDSQKNNDDDEKKIMWQKCDE